MINLKKKLLLVGAFVASTGLIGLGATAAHAATAPALPASPYYVALGDSIAAGAGLTPYGTGSEDAPCLRSTQSYPNLVAQQLGGTYMNVACSGAKTTDGIGSSQVASGVTVPAQLDRAFQYGKPDLVTVTIGANDIRWIDFIGKCYVSTCGTTGDQLAAAGYLTLLQGKLANTLRQIKDRSDGQTPPKVLVPGYYNPVSSTSCLNGQVTGKELAFINKQTDNLNKAIRQTVSGTTKVSSIFKGTYNFTTYVPVSFSGHGICSADPWVQGLDAEAPLHPTATGQQQIANTLIRSAR